MLGLPGKVRHLHHNDAHVFSEDYHIVACVVPFGHFLVEFQFLGLEIGDLLFDLLLFLLRNRIFLEKKGRI